MFLKAFLRPGWLAIFWIWSSFSDINREVTPFIVRRPRLNLGDKTGRGLAHDRKT